MTYSRVQSDDEVIVFHVIYEGRLYGDILHGPSKLAFDAKITPVPFPVLEDVVKKMRILYAQGPQEEL